MYEYGGSANTIFSLSFSDKLFYIITYQIEKVSFPVLSNGTKKLPEPYQGVSWQSMLINKRLNHVYNVPTITKGH